MIGVQSFQSRLPEALLPANDGGCSGLELLLDRAKGHAFGQHQNQLGTKYIAGRQSTRLRDAAELRLLLRGEIDVTTGGHARFDASSLVMVTLRQATSGRAQSYPTEKAAPPLEK